MPKKTGRISERLIERLRRDGWITETNTVRFVRHYPGHWQRSGGAWVWEIEGVDASLGISFGSCHTATECLKAKELVLGKYGSLTPE